MSEQDELLDILLEVYNDGFVYGELGTGNNDQESTSKALAKVKQRYEQKLRCPDCNKELEVDYYSARCHKCKKLWPLSYFEQKGLDRPDREKIKHLATGFWEDLNQDMEDLRKEGWTDEEWFEILDMSKGKLADQILALIEKED